MERIAATITATTGNAIITVSPEQPSQGILAANQETRAQVAVEDNPASALPHSMEISLVLIFGIFLIAGILLERTLLHKF